MDNGISLVGFVDMGTTGWYGDYGLVWWL